MTSYSYDTLGNLTKVNQAGDGSQGARVRTFTYDSLSQLLTATNPESGEITYGYDAGGNMVSKADARGISTTYTYDILNRLTATSHTDGTPGELFRFDETVAEGVPETYPVGRLTSSESAAGHSDYVFVYDALGRITREYDSTPSIDGTGSWIINATYDLASELTSLSYPTGRVVTFTMDTAGRTGKVEDLGNSINYVTGSGGTSLATYTPDGSITGFVSGYSSSFAGTSNTFSYNNRLQPVTMSAATPSATVFSLNYDFHLGASNNGNVYAITNNKDNSRNQTFTYDQLNRLTSAQNAGTTCSATTANGRSEYWGNSYGYDPWGNLLTKTVTKCSAENLQETADTQNRMHATSGTDYSYDAAGNMTHDATANLNYTYDAEDRISTVGGSSVKYTYGPDGERVRKDLGSNYTEYIYFGGNVIAERDQGGNWIDYVFFNGERVARHDSSGVFYYFSDHLKTTDIVTDAQGNIKNESDFYPWGGELQLTANDPNNHYKFTGKERDSETGLDYFGARYYSNGLGRFVTPDWAAKATAVPYAEFADPQSLNLYSYVRNVPTTRFDADGHYPDLESAIIDITTTFTAYLFPHPWQQFKNAISNNISDLNESVNDWANQRRSQCGCNGAQDNQQRSSEDGNKKQNENNSYQKSTQSQPGKQHGNTKGTQYAERYKKYDKNGNFQKHGVSQKASTRYGKKELDGGKVDVVNSGPRNQMLDEERQQVETNPGPDNHEPWAGRQQQQPPQQQPPQQQPPQ